MTSTVLALCAVVVTSTAAFSATDLSVLEDVENQTAPSVDQLKAANDDPDAHLVKTPSLGQIFNPQTVKTLASAEITTPWEHFEGMFGKNSDFYAEPKLTGKEPVGTLLKSKKFTMQYAVAAVWGTKVKAVDAWMTMYTTENIDGEQDISTGVVLVPKDGRNNSTRQVIAYQESNDSLGAYCHPSSQWTGGAFSDASSWSALGPLAQMFGKGQAVVISDVGNNAHPGPNGISEVFAGRYSAKALLNGMRAAYDLEDAGLNPKQPVGFFGVAGGGNGAGFAAEFQPDYYPELNLKGVVLQNFNADQKQFVKFTNGSMASGFGFATIVGMDQTYPEMNLEKHLSPLGKVAAKWWGTQCQTYSYFITAFLKFQPFFKGFADPTTIKDFQPMFADNIMGVDPQSPEAPVLITSCGEDGSFMSVTPAADMRKLVQRYRDKGTEVTYLPSECDDKKLFTDTYTWLTDLFAMHTIDWLAAKMSR